MGPTTYTREGMGITCQHDNDKLLLDMMKVRQEEMSAAELLAGILVLQKDMPWEFYYDLSRHLWDEIRHSMFGQAALESEGLDWRSRPQYTAGYDLHYEKTASLRYAFLSIGVEDAQMKRPGKVAEYEFCRDKAQHPLMAQFQDYDWADEVNHARFGRKWCPELLDDDLGRIRSMTSEMVDEFFEKTNLPLKKLAFSERNNQP